jgi:hypothetical protein
MRLVVGSGVAGLALLMPFNSPAYAGHDDFIDPDNVDHYVDRSNVGNRASDATVHAIGQIDRTKMNATLSGSGDVVVYDGFYGTERWGGARGYTTCVTRTWTGMECDVYHVAFNYTYLAGASQDIWNHVGCHEFGHTAGLAHRDSSNDSYNNSCMRQGGDNQYFDSHDIDQINEDV